MVGTMALVLVLYLLLGWWAAERPKGSASEAPSAAPASPDPAAGQVAASAGKPKGTSGAIHAIDGIRVFATFFILFYHRLIDPAAGLGGMSDPPAFLSFISDKRIHALMFFFFVTSGFVGQLAVQNKIESYDLRAGVSFFVKRILRLVPLYYLSILAIAVWSWQTLPHEGVIAQLYLIQAAFADDLARGLPQLGRRCMDDGEYGRMVCQHSSDIVGMLPVVLQSPPEEPAILPHCLTPVARLPDRLDGYT
jgi:hypothetical protein